MGIFTKIKNVMKANKNATSKPQEKRTLLTMQVGDIVSVEDVDYEIQAVIKFNDHGWKWVEYKLKDARTTYWLSVEQDDDIEISLFEEVVAVTKEIPDKIDYKGTMYYMQEGSDAKVEDFTGKINIVRGEEVDYYEYCDEDDEKLLSIEIWNGEIEMSVGRWIEDFNVEIFPGS